ncbi:VIT1/CCC1 transporter family protein [Candidatus Saccharibacteria bacterium]|nr:VIT1/CCC1 transporter family protein [Candidatus Saccharibacteria bacterium]
MINVLNIQLILYTNRVKHPVDISAKGLNKLRAAVLGANDGIISTASLILGVTGAGVSKHTILIAGFAAIAAGAFSMAVGEYVSVASQKDAEMSIEHFDGEYTSPSQAAIISFFTFSAGGTIPLLAVIVSTTNLLLVNTVIAVVFALLLTGYFSAKAGNAHPGRAMLRILIGGILAMLATYSIGLAIDKLA